MTEDLITECTSCPSCNSSSILVVESRKVITMGFSTKRRRRKCLRCNTRYSTLEVPEEFLKEIFG